MCWSYRNMVYSVSRDAWFYKEGANGEWVDRPRKE